MKKELFSWSTGSREDVQYQPESAAQSLVKVIRHHRPF
jgi:hypothetical protein